MATPGSDHLLHVFPSFEVGGIQVRTAAIINGLDRRFRHSVIALNGDYSCAGRIGAGAPVHLLTDIKAPRSLAHSLISAATAISTSKPDAILTYNWATLDWALANALGSGRAHIHHEDGFNADEAERQLIRRIAYRRLALWRNDLLIVPSHNLYEIAQTVWRRPKTKIQLIPNGIDWREFADCSPPSGSLATSPATVIGTLAPLRREKNIEALLRAAAELRSRHAIELVVVGDGPERQRLQALAAELAIADICRFHGLRHDVAAALAPLDIFVLPSLTEQMPIALLQAMAAAKPVVAYAVGDVAQIVSAENTPYIVARNDAAALTRRTEALVGDAALRHKIGESNRARVRDHYALPAMVERYAACYSDVLSRKR